MTTVGGGLHFRFSSKGERLIIQHAGERLEIICDGRSGKDTLSFRAVGPKSFYLIRPHAKEQALYHAGDSK